MKCFMRCDATGDHLQLLVPRAVHVKVLQQVHDSLLGGHLGQKRWERKHNRGSHRSGIWEDRNNWVTKCSECARVKVLPKRPMAPLSEMLVGAPLYRLATDILGPFPESTQGSKYVLAVTDYFMKWVEIFAIPDQSVVTCTEVIPDYVSGCYGCLYDIHADL